MNASRIYTRLQYERLAAQNVQRMKRGDAAAGLLLAVLLGVGMTLALAAWFGVLS